MKKIFEIYSVKKGETLHQIAERYEMDEDEILAFHHKHYKEAGLRWFNNFVGIEKIAVPANHKTKSERKKEHQHNFPPRNFNKEFFGGNYSVVEKFEDGFHSNLEINYHVEVNIHEKNDETIVEIACKNFLKNGAAADDKMSSLSIACMEAVSPIGLNINKMGRLVKLAHPEVYTKRFSEKRSDIEDFFVGEMATSYLNKFQESWENPEVVFEKFSSQFLFLCLFPGMDLFHKTSEWQEERILGANSFSIKMNFQASYQYEETEFAETQIHGTIAELVDLQEILRGSRTTEPAENPVDATLDVTYSTDKQKKTLQSINGKLILYANEEVYATHSIQVLATEKM